MDANAVQLEDHVHLLRPLRDLAENWNVDLAQELEEYMEELAQVTFRFGTQGNNLNFAQAAMLIQGSACVYGKKVEYLHHLVLEALDLITEQRRAKNERKNQDDRQDLDTEVDEFFEEEEEQAFLNLDDVVVQATEGIDLEEGQETPKETTPMHAKKNNPLLHLEDWSAQRSSAARAAADGSAFRMATCSVHRSGALLLQEGDGDALDEHLRPMQPWTEQDHPAGMEAMDPMPSPREDAPMPGAYDSDDGGDAFAGNYPQSPGSAQEEEEEEYDPYQPLHPDDPDALVVRPLRKGRIRFRAVPKTGSTQLIPAAKVNGPCWPEFNYAFDAIKKKEAIMKAEERARARQSQKTQLHSLFATMGGEETQDDYANEEDEQYGAPQGFESEDEGLGGYGEDEEPLSIEEEAEFLANGSSFKVQEAELSYREICKQHIERLIATAAAAEVQTELSRRVYAWKEKIQPVLDEQEAHGEFDIQEYGDDVLERLVDLERETQDNVISFESLVEGEKVFEVPRRFVATLQLACEGNIQLQAEEAEENKATNFKVLLLSQDHHHRDLLKEFRAPSLMEQRLNVSANQPSKGDGDTPPPKRPNRRGIQKVTF
eukprot:scaffold2858_cov659-Pavlova_lutheri.AAC.38